MAAVLQLFYFLQPFEIIVANRATIFFTIAFFHPRFFWNSVNFESFEAFGNYSIIISELNKLLVCHVISVRIIWIFLNALLALFNCSLQKPFFFSLRTIYSSHAVHHNLHHHISFSVFYFLRLHLHCYLQLTECVDSFFVLIFFGLAFFLFVIFCFVLYFLDLTTEFKVFSTQTRHFCSLSFYFVVFINYDLFHSGNLLVESINLHHQFHLALVISSIVIHIIILFVRSSIEKISFLRCYLA